MKYLPLLLLLLTLSSCSPEKADLVTLHPSGRSFSSVTIYKATPTRLHFKTAAGHFIKHAGNYTITKQAHE